VRARAILGARPLASQSASRRAWAAVVALRRCVAHTRRQWPGCSSSAHVASTRRRSNGSPPIPPRCVVRSPVSTTSSRRSRGSCRRPISPRVSTRGCSTVVRSTTSASRATRSPVRRCCLRTRRPSRRPAPRSRWSSRRAGRPTRRCAAASACARPRSPSASATSCPAARARRWTTPVGRPAETASASRPRSRRWRPRSTPWSFRGSTGASPA
jgi:hypothetical protein